MARFLLLSGSALLLLVGCGMVKDLGLGALPVYDVPDAEFDAAESATLERWSHDDAALFHKIQGLSLARKAVLESHNKWALAKNRERLAAMGFKDDDLKKVVGGK